jgi:hypothetical protein
MWRIGQGRRRGLCTEHFSGLGTGGIAMTIPADVLRILETELDGLNHGTATLTIHVRDGKFRYVVGREQSFYPADEQSAVSPGVFIEKKRETFSAARVLRKGGEK